MIENGIGAPSGAVMAFNLAACPVGWSAADGTNGTPDLRGQFVRGINDFGTGVRADGNEDPDGLRALGNLQQDEFKSHKHGYNVSYTMPGPGHRASDYFGVTSWVADTLYEGGNETRPKNVALIYCQKD